MSNIIQIKHGASDPTPQILQPYELGYKEKEGLYINDGGVVRPVGGQSDYQQNDSAAADFIKNRTHYIVTETEELVNDKLFFTNSGEDRIQDFILKTGSKYKIFFDGGEYECVAFDINVKGEIFQAIGSTFLMNGESSLTNEPFLFLYKDGWYSNFEYYLSSFNVEHIVSIYSIENNNATLLQDKILFIDSEAYIHKITKANFSTEVEVKEEKYQVWFNGEEFNLFPINIDELENSLPIPYFFIGSEDRYQYLENGIPFGVQGLLGFNEAFIQIAAWNISQPDWYDIEIHRTYSFIEPINPCYLPEEGVGYSEIKSTNENFDLVEVIDKLIENSEEYEYVIDNDEIPGKKYIYGNFYVTEPPFEILPNEKYEILLNGKEYKTKSIIVDEELYAFGDIIQALIGDYDDVHFVVEYYKSHNYQFYFGLAIDMEYFGIEVFPKEIMVKKITQEEEIYQINEKYIPYIQQDWNENNPESRSYIANRTHWIEKHRTIILDSLSRNSWSGNEIAYWSNHPIISQLEEGKEYIVAVSSEYEGENAREYCCKCQRYNNESLLLGEDLYENYPNNQYPFGIYIYSDGECSITTLESIRCISISYETEIIHKIDKKFLPEGTGGSGVSSWNDLTDKPFYEEWSHIIINKPELDESFSIIEEETPITFYKISNLKPTKEEIVECLFTSEDGETVEITEDYFAPEGWFIGMIGFEPGVFVVYDQRVVVNPSGLDYTVTFPSTGIWIEEKVYDNFSSLEYDGWNIHPLDEKFIPDSIARKYDVKDIGWNDLIDKPFNKPLTYSWDVNTTPLEVVHWQDYEVCKINNYSPTIGDFAGGKVEITYINSSGTQKEELFLPEMDSLEWEESMTTAQNIWGQGWWSIGEVAIIVTEEEAIINTDLILSKGFWIIVNDSLTEFILSGKYGHIYEDFIPDSIARVDDNPFYPPKVYEYKYGEEYQEVVEYEDGWGDKYRLIKVSNDAPNFYKFIGGNFYIEVSILFDPSQLEEGDTPLFPGVTSGNLRLQVNMDLQEEDFKFEDGFYTPGGYVIVVTKSKVDIDGLEFTKGVWILDLFYSLSEGNELNPQGGIKELNYSMAVNIPPETISEDLIPETIARISQVPKNWDELPGKPFGTAQYKFDFNSILEEKEYTLTEDNSTVNFYYYKYSNYVNPAEDFVGSRLIGKAADSQGQESIALEVNFEISDQAITQQDGYFTILDQLIGVEKEEITLDNGIILSRGMWFEISGENSTLPLSEFYFDKPLYFKPISDKYLPLNTPQVEKASVGQVVVIKSVNKNGKPTAWEAIDPWVVQSSTVGSNKKFRISIDDSGAITATEIN